jgi:hypothetical protein
MGVVLARYVAVIKTVSAQPQRCPAGARTRAIATRYAVQPIEVRVHADNGCGFVGGRGVGGLSQDGGDVHHATGFSN